MPKFEQDIEASEGETLARIGRAIHPQKPTVGVRLSADLAGAALAAWQRDELPVDPERPVDTRRAAALALIGLAVSIADVDLTQVEDVEIQLDAGVVGTALDSAEEDGLI